MMYCVLLNQSSGDDHANVPDLTQVANTNLTNAVQGILASSEDIKDLIGMLSTQMTLQFQQLEDAVRNITGLLADKDGYTTTPLVHTCKEIKSNWPDSPSGYYTIADSKPNFK